MGRVGSVVASPKLQPLRPLRSVAVAAAVFAAGAAGCVPDGSLPDDARVQCSGADECPAGYTCRSTIELCVADGSETEPPSITSSSLEPALASAASEVAVTFAVSETLAIDPVVRLDDGQTFSGGPREGDGGAYRYTYRPSAADATGAHAIVATLIDELGNTADVSVATVTFDFAAPTVLAWEAAPQLLGIEGMGSVTFTVDETLAAAPVVRLVSGEALSESPTSAPPQYVYDYAPSGDESEDGEVAVLVSLADQAGNRIDDFPFAGFTFDFGLPAVSASRIELVPGAGNPLASPTRVKAGTTVRVSLTAVEDLLVTPVVATTTPEAWSIAAVSTAAREYVFAHVLDEAAHPQGDYTVAATLTDLAGNENTIVLGTFAVDTVAPPPPDTTPGNIIYVRIPHGAEPTAGAPAFWLPGAPTFWLEGSAGAVGADTAQVLAFDAVEPAERTEIGRAVAGAAGFEPFPLGRDDRTAVYVVAVDAAGNVSAITGVRDVRWIVTPGPAGGDRNPHRVNEHPWLADVFTSEGRLEVNAAKLGRRDGVQALLTGGGSWERVSQPDAIAGRSGHAMTYDTLRGRMIVYGGWRDPELDCDGSGTSVCSSTWERLGTVWDRIVPPDPEADGDPGPRLAPALAFDSRRGVAVLFGGGPLNDTWEWDGDSWRRAAPQGAEGPPARQYAGAAFDVSRGVVVLHGGAGEGGNLGDTWEWDGATWTETTCGVPGCEPSPRMGFGLTYDALRDRVVLYGGGNNADAWSYEDGSWSELCGPTTAACPAGPTQWGYLTYASDRGSLVLYTETGNLWELTAAGAFVSRCDPATGCAGPPQLSGRSIAGAGATFIYDPARRAAVLFGGAQGSPMLPQPPRSDTWEWDGASWAHVTPADPEADGNPEGRRGHALITGPDGALLIGGDLDDQSPTFDRMASDVWEWTGLSWRSLLPLTAPGPYTSQGAAYMPPADARTGRVLAFGGYRGGPLSSVSDELWEWTVGDPDWVQRCDGVVEACWSAPGARAAVAMAYDGGRDRVVLFGGDSDQDETWEWDGDLWRRACAGGDPTCAGPRGRASAALAYDPASQSVILFGGTSGGVVQGDTWSWNGSAWSERVPTDVEGDGNPPPRAGASLAHLPGRGSLFLFGGVTSNGPPLGDLWEWRAGAWIAVPSSDPEGDGRPLPRSEAGLAYDPVFGRLTLFGGTALAFLLGDTWVFKTGADRAPAHVLHVDFSAADPPAGATVTEVAVQWDAGGLGFTGGVPTSGARVLVWDGAGWREVDSHDRSVAAPATLEWSARAVSESELLDRLFAGDDLQLAFAATPTAPNGAAYAAIVSDYVEVTIRYQY